MLRDSGNSAIQPGRPGYFEASGYVQRRDVPATLDRAQGDACRPEIWSKAFNNLDRIGKAVGACGNCGNLSGYLALRTG